MINKKLNKISSPIESPSFEFHISKKSRDRYKFNDTLFSIKGQIIFADFIASRRLADQINKRRKLKKRPEDTIRAGELNAMGLLDEIMHFVIESYRKDINPRLFSRMEQFLINEFGPDKLDNLLVEFAQSFPTNSVHNGQESASDYLKGKSEGMPNRHILLEELMVLWLDNINPAYKPIKELVNDAELKKQTIYDPLFKKLNNFFKDEPFYGPEKLPLLEMLLIPAKKYPYSITAQLEFIRIKWGILLSSFLSRILISMDFIKEEEKMRFDAGLFGPGPTEVIHFYEDYEPEQFSADLDWMPCLVLIAKSVYVWLDQLSKQYQRSITRLDQIPDEELDRLASAGFSGLWLIGLWERSRASQKIKQICGNPEAAASAYSLKDYVIARDLGGEEACHNLKERAWKRGVRLASDMVPNHMAIDSNWVINHPDWFIQSPHPPFPSYSFNGQDLSDDERVGIFIEDGYWNKTDAAVVFKRLDRYSGNVRYIYHGNDGTSMPWNDTAQLNYLMPQLRESIIQTILHVARQFPIIRFDAAMTLAKKHYQRLWFPQPGGGGDIPSRAEHALTKQRFDELFPVEFWREVVDRVKQEAPDTLLLAEAFWMMEGYFVRTLGMHRVYNSAFMNMLKNEENGKYRESIKNVLEFNPQILKRYVNFMNNPDEETAIAQFGKDDKYFGVCVMMCTMPGLPMFGHGQIEGFNEKYGMEYRRAYWDEQADEWLVRRHERQIYPLLRKRYIFSGVENFLFYDFNNADGGINENVFSYSNCFGSERSLVIYHNKYSQASGWINHSLSYKNQDDKLVGMKLADGLKLDQSENQFVIFRDYISGLEYIRSSGEIGKAGLYLEIGAFKYHVFLDFREVRHTAGFPYADIERYLNGRGAPSIEEALKEFIYKPVLDAFQEAANPGSLRWLSGGWQDNTINKDVLDTFNVKLTALLNTTAGFENLTLISKDEINELKDLYSAGLKLTGIRSLPLKGAGNILKSVEKDIRNYLPLAVSEKLDNRRILLALPFLKGLSLLYAQRQDYQNNTYFIDDRMLDKALVRNFGNLGAKEAEALQEALLLKILIIFKDGLKIDKKSPARPYFEQLFSNSDVQKYIRINRFQNELYFNKEKFKDLLFWLFILTLLNIVIQGDKKKTMPASQINNAYRSLQTYLQDAEKAGYQADKFLLIV